MKINFFGAAQTVTGSQHLVQVNGSSLLLDCGLFQGRRQESFERNSHFPFDPQRVDAVILSHAHIDHSGNLPSLVKHGYRGPIYTTHVTKHLAEVMLLDSAHIQESDAEFASKRNALRGELPISALYTQADARQVPEHLRAVAYGQEFEPIPGVRARLVEAGHILGSAAVVLDIEENGRNQRRKLRLWFSGDIGRPRLPIVRDPVLPEGADFMILESTYGDVTHPSPEVAREALGAALRRTVSRGGKVIIPAFAIGRAQELVYEMQILMDSGQAPTVPIIVDSPLAVEAFDIFTAHPEFFDQEAQAFIRSAGGRKALGIDRLTFIRSVAESKALNTRKEPMVILSASGMAETGRILHHLRNNIENPRNTILIVSWQAPNTLGRRLADGEKQVKIFGDWFDRRAEVISIGGFSAHADQPFLVEYASATRSSLEKVYLVHGEPGPAAALQEKLAEAGIRAVEYPPLGKTVEW